MFINQNIQQQQLNKYILLFGYSQMELQERQGRIKTNSRQKNNQIRYSKDAKKIYQRPNSELTPATSFLPNKNNPTSYIKSPNNKIKMNVGLNQYDNNNKLSSYVESVHTPLQTYRDNFLQDLGTQIQSQNLTKTQFIANPILPHADYLHDIQQLNLENKRVNNYQNILETKRAILQQQYYPHQIGPSYIPHPTNHMTEQLKQTIYKSKNDIMSRNKQINKQLNHLKLNKKESKQLINGRQNIKKVSPELRILKGQTSQSNKYNSPKFGDIKGNNYYQKKFVTEELGSKLRFFTEKIQFLARSEKNYKDKLYQEYQKTTQLEKQKCLLLHELSVKAKDCQKHLNMLKNNQETEAQLNSVIQQNTQLKEKINQLQKKDESNIYLIQFLNRKWKQDQEILQTKLTELTFQHNTILEQRKSLQQKLSLEKYLLINCKKQIENLRLNAINMENLKKLEVQDLMEELQIHRNKKQLFEMSSIINDDQAPEYLQIDQLRKKLYILQKEKQQTDDDLHNAIQKYSHQNKELQFTNKILLQENESLKQLQQNLENCQSNLKQQNQTKAMQINNLLTELTNLKNQFQKSMAIIQNKLKNENEQKIITTQLQLKNKQEQKQKIKSKYIKQYEQHLQLKEQYKILEKKCEVQKEQNQTYNKQIRVLREQLRNSKKILEYIKNQLKSKQQQIQQKQKEIHRKNEEIQTIRDSSHTLQIQLTKTLHKAESLKRALDQREQQLQQQIKKFDDNKRKTDKQLLTLETNQQQLKTQNKSLKNEIESLKITIQSLTISYDDQLKQINSLNQTLHQKSTNQQLLSNNLEQKIQFKEKQLIQKDTIISELKQQINKKQQQLKQNINHNLYLKNYFHKYTELEELLKSQEHKIKQLSTELEYKNKKHSENESSDSQSQLNNAAEDLQNSILMIQKQVIEEDICNQLILILKKWDKNHKFQSFEFSQLLKYLEQKFVSDERIIESQEEEINNMVIKSQQNKRSINDQLFNIMISNKLILQNEYILKQQIRESKAEIEIDILDEKQEEQEKQQKILYEKKKSLISLNQNHYEKQQSQKQTTLPKFLHVLQTNLCKLRNKIQQILNIFLILPPMSQINDGSNQHTLLEILQIIQRELHNSEIKQLQDKVQNLSSNKYLKFNKMNENQKNDILSESHDQFDQTGQPSRIMNNYQSINHLEESLKNSVNNTITKNIINEKKSDEDWNVSDEISRRSNSISFKFELGPSFMKSLSEKIELRNAFQEGNKSVICRFFDFENYKLAKEIFTFFNNLFDYPNHEELIKFQESFLQDLKNIQTIQEQKNALLKDTCQKYFEQVDCCFTNSQQDQDQQDTYLLQQFKPIQNYSGFEVGQLNLLTTTQIPEKSEKSQCIIINSNQQNQIKQLNHNNQQEQLNQ